MNGEPLKVEEPLARSFYERGAVQNNWSVRELERQVNSMFFKRLSLIIERFPSL